MWLLIRRKNKEWSYTGDYIIPATTKLLPCFLLAIFFGSNDFYWNYLDIPHNDTRGMIHNIIGTSSDPSSQMVSVIEDCMCRQGYVIALPYFFSIQSMSYMHYIWPETMSYMYYILPAHINWTFKLLVVTLASCFKLPLHWGLWCKGFI